jgi:hypothetical protein
VVNLTSTSSASVRLLYGPGLLATSESSASIDLELIQADRFHRIPSLASTSSVDLVIRLHMGGRLKFGTPEIIVVFASG